MRSKYLVIEFVIRSGYTDKPELNEDGEPILRRTTALHHAARLKSRHVARGLFKIYKRYDTNYIDEDGLTHFHVACQFDFVGKVARFLVFDQNPDCPPRDPDTSLVESPLLMALRNGSEEMTELLLRAGADPNLTDIDEMTPMHIVCNLDFGCGDLYKISVEKNKPIEVNARDESGRTPLHYALKQERVKEVGFLLSHGADPNIADDEEETPLHVIAKTSCDDNLMGQFFKMCDDNDLQLQVNSKDKFDRAPLQCAVRNLLAKSVGVLLDRGADLTSFDFPTEDYFDQHFLQREITLFNKFPIKLAADAMAIIEHLERKGYALSPTGALTIMNTFAEYRLFQDQNIERSGPEYEKFVMEAREHMMNADLSLYDLMQLQPEEAEQRLTYADYTRFVDSNFEFPGRTGHAYVSHLSETITRGFCRRWAMRSFLEVTRNKFSIPRHATTATLSICGDYRGTLRSRQCRAACRVVQFSRIDASTQNKERKIASICKVCKQFDVNCIDEFGVTHFHIACKYGCDEVVKKFLELGQDPNCFARESVDPPLHLAIAGNQTKVIELLLKSGADPNLSDSNGWTPLHIICKRKRRYDDSLAKLFFEINDEKHQTLLVDAQDKLGRTPLQCAVANVLPDMIDLLLDHGADLCTIPRARTGSQLFPTRTEHELGRSTATLGYRHSRIGRIADEKRRDPNLANEDGLTPLQIICKTDGSDIESAKLLFKISDEKHKPIEINARGGSGWTPLHHALERENRLTAEFLVKSGADLNIADDDGLTSLHILCKTSYGDGMLEDFFKICDDNHLQLQVDVRDSKGRTPLQWAVASFLPESVSLLLNRGADVSSFVFPAEDYYAETFVHREIYIFHRLKMIIASDALAIVEHLEKRGYKLNRASALVIMKTFAAYGIFDSGSFDTSWFDNEQFAKTAKTIIVKDNDPKLSLYDLIQLQPEEAQKLLTFADYSKLADSVELWHIPDRHNCAVHLSEKITRGFCRRWALESFMEVTRNKYPISWYEKLINSMRNEDLYLTCLKASE
ncbi:unnamed protein product [Trichogramma brassicae]|uniref:Uncharacterized protein n=1 Tax=Trichogramma brassicae TaxID=86971 RepID=A0A6H5J479_9HYME|nr:unnamed protein product [Trichogramma brassicae]